MFRCIGKARKGCRGGENSSLTGVLKAGRGKEAVEDDFALGFGAACEGEERKERGDAGKGDLRSSSGAGLTIGQLDDDGMLMLPAMRRCFRLILLCLALTCGTYLKVVSVLKNYAPWRRYARIPHLLHYSILHILCALARRILNSSTHHSSASCDNLLAGALIIGD